MSDAVVVRDGTVLESFEKQSFINIDAVLPLFDSISGPRMSMLTCVNGSVAETSFSAVISFRILIRLQTQEIQFFTTLYASTIIGGGKDVDRGSQTYFDLLSVQCLAYDALYEQHGAEMTLEQLQRVLKVPYVGEVLSC